MNGTVGVSLLKVWCSMLRSETSFWNRDFKRVKILRAKIHAKKTIQCCTTRSCTEVYDVCANLLDHQSKMLEMRTTKMIPIIQKLRWQAIPQNSYQRHKGRDLSNWWGLAHDIKEIERGRIRGPVPIWLPYWSKQLEERREGTSYSGAWRERKFRFRMNQYLE